MFCSAFFVFASVRLKVLLILFPRLLIILRLFGAVVVVIVCYLVLGLQSRRAVWNGPHYLTTIPASPLPSDSSPSPPTTTDIPEKLLYKVGPKGLNKELRSYTNSCIANNPTFRSEFLIDTSGDQFIRDHFADRPDILNGFLAINIPIIRADILCYLVLYQYGGVWNDLDVSRQVPISEWIPENYKADASIVVGMELDVDIWTRQFATWTIMAKPKSPHPLTVVEDCLEGLLSKSNELDVGMQDLRPDMIGDIVDVSGPRRLRGEIRRA